MSGGNFLRDVFSSQVSPANLLQILTLLRAVFVAGAAAFLGAVFFLLTDEPALEHRLLKIYFLLALLVAMIGSGKAGAYTNYYLEPFAVACVLTGVFLQAQRGRWRIVWLGIALGAGLLAVVDDVRGVPAWLPELTRHRELRRAEEQRWDGVLASLRAQGEPVLVEDPYLALRLSPAPFMMDLPLFALLTDRGRFDDADVRRRLATGGFPAVVLLWPLESREGSGWLRASWLEALRDHYRLAGAFPMGDRRGLTYYLYVPAG